MPCTRRLASRSRADRERRRDLAVSNKALREAKTDEQQLERLDERLGTGLGAVKERARLANRIADVKVATSRVKPAKTKKSDVKMPSGKAKDRRKADKKRK